MGKRKGRKDNEPINLPHQSDENGEQGGGKGAGFFACYLLTSLCPRFKGHTYIGYTLNPRRRIRQHNGEIGCGAWRTKGKRPWEMVLCIYGFPTNIAALQFEWAWQHPVESLAVRNAASSFKSLSGLANKIKLAYIMLTLPAWQSLNLTVNLFSTKYQKYTSGCPALPEQMRTKVCSMDELPCYNENACEMENWDDEECDEEGLYHESTKEESTRAASNSDDSPSSGENIHKQRYNANTESDGCLPIREDLFHESTKEESTRAARNSEDSPSSGENIHQQRYNANAESDGCLPIREDDEGENIFINNSPARSSFSSPGLIESTKEFDQPLEKRRMTTSAVANDPLLIKSPDITSHEVEIIDIFTPSPCSRVNSGSKRRKPTLFPEIIDLTNSPIYV